MWSFSKKKRPVDTSSGTASRPALPTFTQLIDYGDLTYLHVNDDELRFWLPETCKTALDETRKAHEMTMACWLREYFVAYTFGEHELMRMRTLQTGLYQTSGVRYSVAPQPVVPYQVLRGLGKNLCAIKLYLPTRLKRELVELADHAAMELSPFIRMLLISRLLGHQAWRSLQGPGVQQHIVAIATMWERGELETETVESDRSSPPTGHIINAR
ncbi:hypothetical protein [Kerstersia sp.]|uniref:hypothetical protein n=1 Tax=Kerstersia sp. TaxID=1930783 RepID=UPI003F8E328A